MIKFVKYDLRAGRIFDYNLSFLKGNNEEILIEKQTLLLVITSIQIFFTVTE